MLVSAYTGKADENMTFELSSNVCHFFIYSFLLEFLHATRPNVRYELDIRVKMSFFLIL